jgi:predicted SAM-dependent methyltransferase
MKIANKLNVGCGRSTLPGWINLDGYALHGVDIVADLEQCVGSPLPIASDSISEFLLSHVLEHIQNALPMMQELYRIAVPEAIMTVRVPYGSSDDAFEDPTHVR